MVGQAEIWVTSNPPSNIDVNVEEVTLGIGDIKVIIISILDADSHVVSIPSGFEIEVSSNCDTNFVWWEWSGSNLIIHGDGYADCVITLTLRIGDRTISKSFPVTVVGVGSVTGTVLDAVESVPVVNANVSITGLEIKRTATNASGQFSFDSVAAGSRRITVTKTGYKSLIKDVNIISDNITNVPIVFNPETTIIHGRIIYECSGVGINNVSIELENYEFYTCTTHSLLVGEEMDPGYFEMKIPVYIPESHYRLKADRGGKLDFSHINVAITPGSIVNLGDLNMRNLEASLSEFVSVETDFNFYVTTVPESFCWYDVGIINCEDPHAVVVDVFIEVCNCYGYFQFFDFVNDDQLDLYKPSDNTYWGNRIENGEDGLWLRLCPSNGLIEIKLWVRDHIHAPKELIIPRIRYWK